MALRDLLDGKLPILVGMALVQILRADHGVYEEPEYEQALSHLRNLEQLSASDESLESLTAFTYAGLCIAHAQLGNANDARDANSRLTNHMKAYLRQNEQMLFRRLQSSLQRLGE